MANKPVATLTARVQIDKQESFKRFEKSFKEFQKKANENEIVYTIKADKDSLIRTLKEIADSEFEIGTDIVLNSRAKDIQAQINELLSQVSKGMDGVDLGIADNIKKELAAVDKEIAAEEKKLATLNKKKNTSKSKKSADDIFKEIKASHNKLQTMPIDTDTQLKEYEKEVKHLRDLAAAFEEVDKSKDKSKQNIVKEYLRNEELLIKSYKGNASNILGETISKAEKEEIVQIERTLKDLRQKREEIQNRLDEVLKKQQEQQERQDQHNEQKKDKKTKDKNDEDSEEKKSNEKDEPEEPQDKHYKIIVDAEEAKETINEVNSLLDDISNPRALVISNLEEANEIVNNIVSSLNNLGKNVSPGQRNDLANVILDMMNADIMMDNANRADKKLNSPIHERVMFYNKDTQDYSNPYVHGGRQDISLNLEKELKKRDKTKYNSYFHSHPERIAALSVATFDKELKQYNGDLLKMLDEGYEEAIIAARSEVQIFDVAKFREQFGKYFSGNNREIAAKNLVEASQELFTEYYQKQFSEGKMSINWENFLTSVIPDWVKSKKEITSKLKENDFTSLFVDYLKTHEFDSEGSYKDDIGVFRERLTSFVYDMFSINPKVTTAINKNIAEIYKKISLSPDKFQEVYRNFTPDIIKKALGISDLNWDDFQEVIPLKEFQKRYKELSKGLSEELEEESQQDEGINIPINLSPNIQNPQEFINNISKQLEGYFVEVGILPITGDEKELQERLKLIADAFKKAISNFGDSATALVDEADEKTAEAQKSESPSKVAMALGEYWGIGYAEGILEHKDDVAQAVQELVNTGKLTIQNLMTDLAFNIKGKEEYKDLVSPVEEVINKNKTFHKAESIKDLREQYKLLRIINKDIQGRKKGEASILNASLDELEKDKKEILSLNSALESVANSVNYINQSDFLKLFGSAFPEELQQAMNSISTGVKKAKEETNKAVKISINDFKDLLKQVDGTKISFDELNNLTKKFYDNFEKPGENAKAKEVATYAETLNLLKNITEQAGYKYDNTVKKLVKLGEVQKEVETQTKKNSETESASTTTVVQNQQETQDELKQTAQVSEQTTDQLTEGFEYSSESVNRLNKNIKEYIELSKIAEKGSKSIIDWKYSGNADQVSQKVNSSDIRQNRTTKTSVKRELDRYLKIQEELKTGVNEFGSPTYFNQGYLDDQLEKLAAYVYSFHNAEEAAKIFGEKNKDVFDKVQNYIKQSEEASKAFKNQQYALQKIIRELSDYNLESMTFGQRDQLEKAIKFGGLQAFADKVKELFGIEIPLSIKKIGESLEDAGQQATETGHIIEQTGNQVQESLEKATTATTSSTSSAPIIPSQSQQSQQISQQIQEEAGKYDLLAESISRVVEKLEAKIPPLNEESTIVNTEVPKEIQKFDELNQKINDIILTIASKIAMVRQERAEVEQAVDAELIALQKLTNQPDINIKLNPDTKDLLDTLRNALNASNIPINIAPINTQNSTVSLTGEEKDLDSIQTKLSDIITLIDEKTSSFEKEKQVVDGVTQAETTALDTLLGTLDMIRKEVDGISEAFNKIPLDKKVDTKWVKNLTQFTKADGQSITTLSDSLKSIYDTLGNLNFPEQNFIHSINNILEKGKELGKLAEVIKEANVKVTKMVRTGQMPGADEIEEKPKRSLTDEDNKRIKNLQAQAKRVMGHLGEDLPLEKFIEYQDKLKGIANELDVLSRDVVEKDKKRLTKLSDNVRKQLDQFLEETKIVYNGIYLNQKELTTDKDFSYTERKGYYQQLAGKVHRNYDGTIDLDQSLSTNYKALEQEIMKTDKALLILDRDIERTQEIGADPAPLEDSKRIMEEYLNALEKEYKEYIKKTQYMPDQNQKNFFETERAKNKALVQNSIQQNKNNEEVKAQEKEINNIIAERIAILNKLSTLEMTSANATGSDNLKVQEEERRRLLEISELEARNATLEQQQINLVNQLGHSTEKENDLLEAQVNYNKAINDATQQRKAVTDEINRKKSNDEATASNNKAASLYKELLGDAKDYYDLITKQNSGKQLTNVEYQRLAELEGKWKKATAAVDEYSMATNGSAASIRKYNEAKENFDNNNLSVANEQKRLEIIKDLKKYTDLLNGASEKWLGDFINKIKEAQGLIQGFNDNGFDFTSVQDIANLERLLTLKKEIESEKGLQSAKKAAEESIEKLRNKITDFMKDNSAMGAEFEKKFKKLKINLDSAESIKDVKDLTVEFLKLENEVKAAGKTGKSFFKTIGEHLKSINAQFFAQYLSFQDLIRYGRTVINSVYELDTALIDLKKTTTMNNQELESFYKNSSNIAKQLGVTTKEIIEQASSWSRLNNIGLLYGNV